MHEYAQENTHTCSCSERLTYQVIYYTINTNTNSHANTQTRKHLTKKLPHTHTHKLFLAHTHNISHTYVHVRAHFANTHIVIN